ncbi:MAG: metal-sensitive transcriptional regulator [Candidatus Dormibacteria bacterium]
MKQFNDKRRLLNALSRLEGQVRGIKAMVDADRDCAEIIQQISAVRSALDMLGVRLVADNLRACVEEHEIPAADRVRMETALGALVRRR